jgi:hypothetical protein
MLVYFRKIKVHDVYTKAKLFFKRINPLNAELNPTCHLLALVGAHHILHVSRIRVKTLYCPTDAQIYNS